ncbi:MAG: sugar porter family MFS transporter [Lachnospiraceae bacterium]|nr:sugar porter family MFS transporter [Lachnospiraceae bacterium]
MSQKNVSTSESSLINCDTMPLRWGHIRVVISGSLGQLIGQGLAALISVVIPMVQLASHPELSAGMQGILGCMSLIGICAGAFVFGKLSDRYGYLLFFRLCPLLILLSSIVAYYFHGMYILLLCLFVMGFCIGGEYSLDSDYISETMPDKYKVFMVGVAKASSSVGNIIVAALCFWIIRTWDSATNWPELLLIITGISAVILLTRIHFAQSPGWLMAHGRTEEAEKAIKYFLGNDVEMAVTKATKSKTSNDTSFPKFLKDNVKEIILTGIPWACEGLGVYGIGIFMPTLIIALGLSASDAHTTPMGHIVNSVEITIWLSAVMVIGFIIGLSVLRKISHIKLQAWGFILCAVGLTFLLLAYKLSWASWIAISGFMMFELFLNIGPHLVTFILPSQIYPVDDRGTGNGMAASIGKLGAVLGAFFIPVLLRWGGCTLALIVSIAVMIVGAGVTAIVGKMVLKNCSKTKI